MSGETPGRRETIQRMTRQLHESSQGRISKEEARRIATNEARKADRRENR